MTPRHIRPSPPLRRGRGPLCLALLTLAHCLPHPAAAQAPTGAWVYLSPANNLLYQLDERGQRIADFSNCGYRGGTEPLPNVTTLIPPERWRTVSPVDGDDRATVQAAIDAVEAFTPDSNGWRGVVFLNAGEYQFAQSLTIQASGVVLKGAGSSATSGTRLRATDPRQYTLISVTGSGSRTTVSGTTHNLIQKLVPAGTRTFEVDSTSGLAPGHSVIVKRPSTTEWIEDLDMDLLGPASGGDAADVPWTAGSKDLTFDRVITGIDGNWITVDAPLPQTFESQYGGGQVWRYTWSGRLNQVGIEDLYGVSDYASSTDEDHGWKFIQINNATNAWVRNITAQYFGYSAVSVGRGAKWLTVADCQCLDPISVIDGGRRYSFNNEGAELTLFVNNRTRKGRHDFVFGSLVPGPNAFVHGTADTAYSDTGPHHRWSVGGLFDNITVNGDELNAQNRGNSGTGHGWAGAYMAVWNSVAEGFRVRNPPTARNWLVGSTGAIRASAWPVGADPAGTYDRSGTSATPVHPRSLYYGQLQQRLRWPASQFREVWLGDVDQHYSTGGAGNAANCNPAWLAQVDAATGIPVDSLFDLLTSNRYTAFTFDFTLDPGHAVVAAQLVVSLRATSAVSDNDVLMLESTAGSRPFSSLGWTPLSTTASSVRTLEIDPATLADGRLNAAVGDDCAVDFATLLLQIQPPQPATHTLALTPAADAYVRAGTYATTNFGTDTSLQTKDVTASDVNREAYLRWDLTGIRGDLVDARVRLAGTTTSQPGNESCACLVASDSWSESAVTFNNKPAAGKLFAQWLPVAGQPVEFSVTPQVADTLAGDRLLSLRLASTANFGGAGNVSYASREAANPATRPQLLLTFVNTAPSLTSITNQTVDEDTPPPALPFTVADDFTPAAGLTVTAASSDPTLVPAANITLGGTGPNRTVTITPAPGRSGTATVTLTASDGALTSESSFQLTVLAVNDPPLATAGTAATTHLQPVDIDLRPLAGDEDSPTDQLFYQAGAASHGTVAILADGRTARFTPADGFLGAATFTFTVTDPRPDPRRLFHYRFDPPDTTADGLATDDSPHARHASLAAYGAASCSYAGIPPLPLPNTSVLALTSPDPDSAARLTRTLTASDHDLRNANWTFATWFQRAASADDDFLFYIGSSDGQGGSGDELQLFCPAGTPAPLTLRHWNVSNIQDLDLTSAATVEPGRWHHAAVTFTRTTTNTGSFRLFLDGLAAAGPATISWSPKQTSPLVFGGHNSTTTQRSRFLNGHLDDLALFNAALSESDVSRLAARPVSHLAGHSATASLTVTITGSAVESWRFARFGTASNIGPAADSANPDGDRWTNTQEYTFGTNPLAPDAHQPGSISHTPNAITINFPTRQAAGPGYDGLTRFYSVESTSHLANPTSWAVIPGYSRIAGLGQTITVTQPANSPHHFFRLRVTLE